MSRRRLPSTVSLVLVHPQRVEPRPPINSIRIYRNLLPILTSVGLSGELDKFRRCIGRPRDLIVRYCRGALSGPSPVSEIIDFSIEASGQGLQIFSYTRTSPEPTSEDVDKLRPKLRSGFWLSPAVSRWHGIAIANRDCQAASGRARAGSRPPARPQRAAPWHRCRTYRGNVFRRSTTPFGGSTTPTAQVRPDLR